MMARRRSGIKVYRAEAGKTKRDRESLSLFALQSAALIILMVFWWNAFLSVFRLPFDVRRLYAGTAGAVLLLGVLNRYRGAAAAAAGMIPAALLLWMGRDVAVQLYEWILQNQDALFSGQPAGSRSFSGIAVLVSVPFLELLLWIQRTGRGKVLAGLFICAPFIAAACAGWFQESVPSWLLVFGAVLYFASSVPGAGRVKKGIFIWGNAALAVIACAAAALISYRAGLVLDAGRAAEDSFYYQMRDTITEEVIGGIEDALADLTGTEQNTEAPVSAENDTDPLLPEEPEAWDQEEETEEPYREEEAEAPYREETTFEQSHGEDYGTTDLGRIAGFDPATGEILTLVLEEKPQSTVYYAESYGIRYSDDTWNMRATWFFDEDPERNMEECTAWPEELADTLAELCEGRDRGSVDEAGRMISRELQSRAVYDTSPGAPPEGEEFLHYFLFENHKGFCVHFATAATLMYRYCGYAARYAEGYAVPASAFQETSSGQYEAKITGDMGHAWCQVYREETGEWTDMEHTPPAPENVSGQPPAASDVYEKTVADSLIYDVLPVLGAVCLAAGLCAAVFFGQAALRSARREQKFRKKKGGEGIREMYAAVIKTAKFQGEKIREPLCEDAARRLFELYPGPGEESWEWLYDCVMKSLFYNLDDEKGDWAKARDIYAGFRKAALGQMSRGQRWRYRYVRCL